MNKVTSKDGTQIAYDKRGEGPAVILVDGALCHRAFGPMPRLSELLSSQFTVINYDRRGRGDSSDTQPYALEREIEDIDALIEAAGESVYMFGTSSGACLALEAASQFGGKIKKLAMYEPPYNSEPAARQAWKEYRQGLDELLPAGRRGDAAALFMRSVGTPDQQIEGMRQSPIWPMFEAVAPTLAYDAAALGADRSIPVERASKVSVPVLVMNGTAIPFMLDTANELAEVIPNAEHKTLEGQTHDVSLEVLTPVVLEFFGR
jgi:pimeloyl-ACP methyl ester carboxylesterase